jgi:Protein phosphatase 2C
MWRVVGGSVAGTTHEAKGTECQDASQWHVSPGVVCLAVADGAGSRPRSRHGAQLAVERALLLVAERADDSDPSECLRLVFTDVRDHITAIAAAEGNDPGDYAATLAVAILAGDVVCAGQVGDTIVVTGCRGEYRTADPAPRSEYVNETSFVTDKDALEQLRISVLPPSEVDAVFLSTDGLRFKILADLVAATPFAPFFEDVTAYIRSGEASTEAVCRFLAGLDDQSGDDKSLVGAVRTEAARNENSGAGG